MIGTFTDCAICCTNANVPICVFKSSDKNIPRCPPASSPCAIIASTPCASNQRASSTVVAEDSTLAPHFFTCFSNSGVGRPKWKLTTAGLNSSRTSAAAALNGTRPCPVGIMFGSMPYSRKYGISVCRQIASRLVSISGGVWQKQLTLYGFVVCALMVANS